MSDAAADEFLDTDQSVSGWYPPEGLGSHSGNAIPADADFFTEPPSEIGELVSADTTMRVGSRPWKTATRIVITGLIAWSGYILADVFSKNANPINQNEVFWGVLFFSVLFTPIAWFLTRFSHTCSFVGKEGLAQIKCRGSRVSVSHQEVFVFAKADELRTSQTRMYHNGIYTGTTYRFIWTDHEGTRIFKLSGTYRGEKAPPKPKDPFHFAVMAEQAWSVYLFDKIIAEVNTNQSARFNLSGKNFVAIGPGFLDILVSGSEPIRLTTPEIGGFQIDAGVVKINHFDAKEGWFSSTGVYKFTYDQMANSRLFLILYSHLIGQ